MVLWLLCEIMGQQETHDEVEAETDRPVPSDIPRNKRADVNKRLVQAEKMRRGSNIPSGMDMYLAGYIDAHYQFKDELDTLESTTEPFDSEVRDAR